MGNYLEQHLTKQGIIITATHESLALRAPFAGSQLSLSLPPLSRDKLQQGLGMTNDMKNMLISVFRQIIKDELLQGRRQLQDFLNPLLFLYIVVFMFPLTTDASTLQLQTLAPGAIWGCCPASYPALSR